MSSSPAQDIEQMTKKCPECAETIKFEAVVCKHCHYRFDPADVARQLDAAAQQVQLIHERQAELIAGPGPTNLWTFVAVVVTGFLIALAVVWWYDFPH